MASAEINRPAYIDQNVVVVYVGEDGGYFVGRQTPEQAEDTVSYFEQPEWITRHGEADRLVSVDWGNDSDMAQICLEDIRGTIQDEAIEASKYGRD